MVQNISSGPHLSRLKFTSKPVLTFICGIAVLGGIYVQKILKYLIIYQRKINVLLLSINLIWRPARIHHQAINSFSKHIISRQIFPIYHYPFTNNLISPYICHCPTGFPEHPKKIAKKKTKHINARNPPILPQPRHSTADCLPIFP